MPTVSPTPSTNALLIYDDENADIEAKVNEAGEMLDLYSVQHNRTQISSWNGVEDSSTRTVFFVSIETEAFHSCVKKMIKPEIDNVLVVLINSTGNEQYLNRIMKDIKKKARGNNEEKVSERMRIVEEKVLRVLNLDNVSVWWPQVLYFLQGTKDTFKKEIGVSYFINQDKEKQMSWFAEQRRTLEECFRLRCARVSPSQEEKYVKNSQCVVMYLYSNDLVHTRGRLTEEQKRVMEFTEKYGCKLRVFVNKINTACHGHLEKGSKLKMSGEGALEYWVGLLHDLRLVKVYPKHDETFYSKIQDGALWNHYKNEERDVTCFTARSGFIRPSVSSVDIRPIAVAGDSLRGRSEAPPLKDVCYKYSNHDNTPNSENDDDAPHGRCYCRILKCLSN